MLTPKGKAFFKKFATEDCDKRISYCFNFVRDWYVYFEYLYLDEDPVDLVV